MFSIEAKLAYDKWHKHAQQYNELLRQGYIHSFEPAGKICDACNHSTQHVYELGDGTYCYACAVLPQRAV